MSAEPMTWMLLLFLGMCTGLLAGIFGLGGGILIVPVLTLWGFPVVEAAATSLIGVFLTSISGTLRNWWTGNLNWRDSFKIALFGIPAAQLGAGLGSHIPDACLALCFAVLMLVAIYLMSLRQTLSDPFRINDLSAIAEPQKTENLTSRQWKFAQIGCLGGAIAGLFGIGGGIVMIPLQILLIGESIQSAVPTTLAAVVAISASGLAQYAWSGDVLWTTGLCIGTGGILGAQIGTRLLPHLSATLVNRLFRLLLFALSLYMINQGLATQLI